MITLQAQLREGVSREALQEKDLIPAVYYGAGKDAVSISISAKEFTKVFKEAGETTAITLVVGTKKVSTLIHDMQRDPITHAPRHIDFLVIDMNQEIEVPVPVEFTGLAEAEKGGLGTLVKVLHEIHVRALPAKLPHALIVDVTPLATLEDQIHVKDIQLPEGVTLVTGEDEVVALIASFKEEKEEEVATPVDFSTIEVEKKGKKEDEEVTE